MKRIGIFGGTFNPIHNGHISLCKACAKLFSFDELYLIPSNVPPHKLAVDLAPNSDRLNMVKLAANEIKNAVVSDIEFKLGDKSYTIFTLERLKRDNADAELYLIIGSDMLLTFHEWHRYEDILRLVTVVAGGRILNITDNMRQAADKLMSASNEFADKIKIVEFPIKRISSTQIRKMIKEKKDVKNLLPNGVYEYINSHSLYI